MAVGEVHVWRASLDQDPAEVNRLRSLLDENERQRADRFTFEEHRRRFTVGRGFLREILGDYCGSPADAVRFRYNGYGKPYLDGDSGHPSVSFNLSHTGGTALYAVSRGRELGVDVETIRPEFAAMEIAQRFFAEAEVEALRALDGELRVRSFFACWTRKESYVKARGRGLALSLDAFEVSVRPDEPPAIRVTHDDPLEAGRWTLFHLEPGPGLAGALTVEGTGCVLRVADWPAAPPQA